MMEFPSVGDGMSLNGSPENACSPSSERTFAVLEDIYRPHGSDDESSETSSPAAESPVHKRYLYPQKEIVDTLRPEELRWFYRSDATKKWQAFIGYDSLRIECRYRALAVDQCGDLDVDERILVLGGLYEVDVNNKKCHPVYWSGNCV
jgi:hypothetical protein